MANPLPKTSNLTRQDYVKILDMPSKEYRAAKAAMSVAEREELGRVWLEESQGFFEYYNRYIEENGLPLAEYRQF